MPDSLGLASVRLGFRRPAERARDERVAARAGRGAAEVERLPAPVLDQLAVGLFLPAYCALERAFAEERRSFLVVRAESDRAQHRLAESVVVVRQRVRVRDLLPEAHGFDRVGLERDGLPQEADLLVERIA